MSDGRLSVRVVSPERTVFEGEADSLLLPGALGQLGVLSGHARLITALRAGVLEVRTSGGVFRLAVFGGFAEIGENVVTVLADSAERSDEIDPAAARAEKAAAQEALQTASDESQPAARARIEAAEARLAAVV